MTLPGTWRVSDGSPVHFTDAVAAWTSAAIPALESVARVYNATITYLDLGEQVQDQSGIRTRMLLMNWIGQVLAAASRVFHRMGQPLLSALCIRADGTIGDGWAFAVKESYGIRPEDIEMHAAEERLRCYKFFGADLPPGGGVPALTRQVAAQRAAREKQYRPEPTVHSYCPSCHLALPVSRVCDNCS